MKKFNRTRMKKRHATLVFSLFLAAIACKKTADPFPLNPNFQTGFQSGNITEPALAELSGLAASEKNKGLFWANTDGGNPDELYLMDSTGKLVRTFQLKNCKNHDWEDLAVGPGPLPGKSFVYLADIGDNQLDRLEIQVLRFEEPDADAANSSVKNMDTLAFLYPGGERFNAESVMIDSENQAVFVATKGPTTKVFIGRQPLKTGGGAVNLLQLVAEVPLKNASAGDISADGEEIAIRNNDLIFYWKTAGKSISETLANQSPERLPSLPEPQGEAFAWSRDGRFYLTGGEQKNGGPQPIHLFKRK